MLHVNVEPGTGFWLGCEDTAPPMGIDSEFDGKTSPMGAPMSFCAELPVDCVESTPIGDFGQDECFGDDDAGLEEMPTMLPCTPSMLKLRTFNCLPDERTVFLNVLVDMNGDGDWNDNFQCPGECAYEWALKNVPVSLPPGCFVFDTPAFLVGPLADVEGLPVEYGWIRISLSEDPAPDDYPWNGSVGLPTAEFRGGETEDYLVAFGGEGEPCDIGYQDFGDAPEGITAYSTGIVGAFPTCTFPGAPGTQEIDPGCSPLSTPPGPTGYVEHVKTPLDPVGFWWGCDMTPALFIDSEPDGKVNVTPVAGTPSSCDDVTPVDCIEALSIPGLSFGQDECFGDGVDAGLLSQPRFDPCTPRDLRFRLFNCSTQPIQVYVNLLFDWNEDGDWNDVLNCPQGCAPEWAVKNLAVILPPGCSVWTSPMILPGEKEGYGWMRATVTEAPVPDDFPWAGSAGMNEGPFFSGETEDYPIRIGEDPTSVNLGSSDDAAGLSLSRVAPTPSVTHADVRFSLTRTGPVRLTAYDVTGRRVRTLVDEVRGGGAHTERWDLRDDSGRPVAPGLYFLRLEAENDARTTRVTRVR